MSCASNAASDASSMSLPGSVVVTPPRPEAAVPSRSLRDVPASMSKSAGNLYLGLDTKVKGRELLVSSSFGYLQQQDGTSDTAWPSRPQTGEPWRSPSSHSLPDSRPPDSSSRMFRQGTGRSAFLSKFAETGIQGMTGSAGIGTGVIRFHQVARTSSERLDRRVAWITAETGDGSEGSRARFARASGEVSRRRWSSAIGSVRHSTRQLIRRRKEKLSLYADIKAALRSFVVFAGLVMVLGTALYLIEGDAIYEQTKDKFVFADRLHREYCAWMGCVYVSYLSAHRVGFGDILVKSTAGRATVMLFATACTPMSVIFTMKCSELLKRALDVPANRYVQKYGRKALDAFYIGSTFLLLVFLMFVNMLCLIFVKDDFGYSLSVTDALWFSWSMFTTVGYGDISFATLPKVTVGTWMMEYTFFIFGAVLMDTLISWAFLLLGNSGPDELDMQVYRNGGQGVEPEKVGKDPGAAALPNLPTLGET